MPREEDGEEEEGDGGGEEEDGERVGRESGGERGGKVKKRRNNLGGGGGVEEPVKRGVKVKGMFVKSNKAQSSGDIDRDQGEEWIHLSL